MAQTVFNGTLPANKHNKAIKFVQEGRQSLYLLRWMKMYGADEENFPGFLSTFMLTP